ncbi:MAG TPA: VCBS domain-containing protein, partial [Pseudolabrys sp.]|nr:VCBS domain-containing protein [Pseudolabrys sp.]
MLRTSSDPHFGGGLDSPVVQEANADSATDAITIPDSHLLYYGEFKRAGNDLTISDEKHEFIVHDYFLHDQHPTLRSPKGGTLTPDVVLALAGPQAPGQYAQATAPQGQQQPIGRVVTVTGNVVAIRNGVSVTLNVGDAVLKGDVLQTGGDGSLAVTFNDGSTFNLGVNARIVLNEFVYEQNGVNNSSVVNLIRGQLSFIAGEVAHTGDMKIVSPVATMGIRGTVGITSYGDHLELTVADQGDGQFHAIAISVNGVVVGQATNQSGTWVVTASGAQEIARQTNLVQDLQVVQQLLNLQTVGQQIIQQLQGDVHSTQSQGSSSFFQVFVQKEGNDLTKITTVSSATTTAPESDTGPKPQGAINGPSTFIPPPATNSPPIFDNGPVVVHVATQNTGTRLAPQDPGVVLHNPDANNALAPDVSADGHRVVFETSAALPGSGNGDLSNGNVWLFDQTSGAYTNISALIPNGAATYSTFEGASISLDGNTVVFQGDSSGGQHSDVYIYSRLDGTVKLLMPGAGNAHVDGSGHFVVMEGHLPTSSSPGLDVLLVAANTGTVAAAPHSDNHITFTSDLLAAAGNPTVTLKLAVEHGTLAAPDIDGLTVSSSAASGNFVLTVTGSLTAINDALRNGFDYTGTGVADTLTLSADGAAFQAQGLSFHSQTFSFDATGNEVSSAAVVADFSGGSAGVWSPEINSDGHYITFETAAQEVEINGQIVSTVYVNGNPIGDANNPYEGNGQPQVYRYDQSTGKVDLISVSSTGAAGNAGSGITSTGDWSSSLSADGRYVVFQSDATNLIPGDSNGSSDVFVYDTVDHTIQDVSVATGPLTFAQTFSNQFRVNSATSGNQTGQAAAALNDGSYVVVWASDAQDGGTSGVFGQRYDGDGHTIGAQFQIAASAVGAPAATALSNGGYLVTWTSGGSVLAQQFDATGAASGNQIAVNDAGHAGQGTPSATALSNGGFVVVWSSGTNVYGQLYDASGQPAGTTEFAVNTAAAQSQSTPAVAALANGGFVVTWTGSDASGAGVWAQLFDATGAAVGSAFAVNTATAGDQTNAAVTTLADGSFVVTWDGANGSIEGQHFSAAGGKIGAEFTVNAGHPGNNSSVAQLPLLDGGFVVTWTGSDGAVYGQRFAADSTTVGSAFQVNSGASTDSHSIATALASGDVVVTWQSGDGSDSGIFGQLFTGTQTQVNANSYRPEISLDGRYIIFASDAALVASDTNGQTDTYVYDRWTQQVSLVSQTAGQIGFANESLGDGINSGGFVSAFGGIALAFNHSGTATKSGSVITFANSGLSDLNVDAGTITLTVSVAHGTLQAVSSAGLTVDPTLNGSTGILKVTGTLTDIDAALKAGVKYTPASGYTGLDALTLNAVDATGDGATQVVNFNNSLSNPVTGPPIDTVTSNVYAVDSSGGTAGAVLDDPKALTYQAAQASGIVYPDVDSNPSTQTPGFVFSVPNNASNVEGVLQSAQFTIGSGATGGAQTFKLALFAWDGTHASGPAIFTSDTQSLFDPVTQAPITNFSLGALNIPVDPGKQYVWEVIASGSVTTPAPATLNFAPALTTTGVVSFLDTNDTHTVAVAAHDGDWGNLVAWVGTDTTNGNNLGTVNWAYEVDPSAAAGLTIGQTHSDTFTLTLTDSGGNVVTKNVTVTVIGTNEVPVIAQGAVNDSFTENPGQTGHSSPADAHTASGTFTFTDFNAAGVDTSDSHTVTAELASSAWSAGDFNTPQNANLLNSVALFAQTANVQGSSATFAAWLAHDATNSAPGTIDWNFQLPDNAVDFLAAGETLTLTYDVTVTDSHLASSTQTVTVTLTGTNDQPTITSSTQAATITEDGGTVGSGGESGPEGASGTITFTDVDLSDIETSSITNKQLSASLANGYTLTTAQHDALLNAFSIDAATHSTADGSGTIGWHYNIDDSALDFLGANDVVTLTYTVQTSDGNGGTASQDVTITVKGTDDKPTISAHTDNAVTEDDGKVGSGGESGTESTSGTVNFADVDLSDTHTVSATPQDSGYVGTFTPSIATGADSTGSGTGTVGWTFSVPDSAIDYLG